MVPLPKLKSGQKRNAPKKNIQKLLKISKNKKKKHIHQYKSSNVLGESYIKPCAESNGTTPGFENWFNEKKYAQKICLDEYGF